MTRSHPLLGTLYTHRSGHWKVCVRRSPFYDMGAHRALVLLQLQETRLSGYWYRTPSGELLPPLLGYPFFEPSLPEGIVINHQNHNPACLCSGELIAMPWQFHSKMHAFGAKRLENGRFARMSGRRSKSKETQS